MDKPADIKPQHILIVQYKDGNYHELESSNVDWSQVCKFRVIGWSCHP